MRRQVLFVLHCDLEASPSLGVLLGAGAPPLAPWARVVIRAPAPPAPEELTRLLGVAARMLDAADGGALGPWGFRAEGPDSPASGSALASLRAAAHSIFGSDAPRFDASRPPPAPPREAPWGDRFGAAESPADALPGGVLGAGSAGGPRPGEEVPEGDARPLVKLVRTYVKKFGGAPDFSWASPRVSNYLRSVTARPDLSDALVEQIRISLAR